MDRLAEKTYMDWQTIGRVPDGCEGLVLYVHLSHRAGTNGGFDYMVQLYETPSRETFGDFCEDVWRFGAENGPLPHPDNPILLCSGDGYPEWKATLACVDVRVGGSPQRAVSRLLDAWLHRYKAGEGYSGGIRLRLEIHTEDHRTGGPYYVFEATADWLPAEFRKASERPALRKDVSKVALDEHNRKNGKGFIRGVHFK